MLFFFLKCPELFWKVDRQCHFWLLFQRWKSYFFFTFFFFSPTTGWQRCYCNSKNSISFTLHCLQQLKLLDRKSYSVSLSKVNNNLHRFVKDQTVLPCNVLSRALSSCAIWGKGGTIVGTMVDRGATTAIQLRRESVLWMNRVRANRPISGGLLPTVAKSCSNTRTFLNYLAEAVPGAARTYRRDYYRAVTCQRSPHEGLGQGVTITTRLIPRFAYLDEDQSLASASGILRQSKLVDERLERKRMTSIN